MKSLFRVAAIVATTTLLMETSAIAGPSHLTIKFSKAIPQNLCKELEGKPEEFTIQPWEIRATSGDLLTVSCEPTPKKSKNTQVNLIFRVENLGPGAHSHQYPWGKSASGSDKAQFADKGSCKKMQKVLAKVAKAQPIFFESEIVNADLTLECISDKNWGTALNFELQTIGK